MPSIPNHDAAVGPLLHCQITGSSDLELVIDLDCQPLCDSLLTKDQLNQPETHYPLRLYICPESGLAQLDYVVDGSVVYHPDYPYRSGITKELEVYQRAFARRRRRRSSACRRDRSASTSAPMTARC